MHHIWLCAILLATSLTAFSQEVGYDSVAPVQRRNIMIRLMEYINSAHSRPLTTRPYFTPLGGPYYSEEEGFGLATVMGGAYSTDPSDPSLPPSNISLKANVATRNYYYGGLEGEHISPAERHRFHYLLKFYYYTTLFWGIGYDMGADNANKLKFRGAEVRLRGTYEYQVVRHMFAGPTVAANYIRAIKPERPELWCGQDLSHFAVGVGGALRYDSRDNHTVPTRGFMSYLAAAAFPRGVGNGDYGFSQFTATVAAYRPLWRGAVIAGRANGVFTVGNTPWGMMPRLGENTMRAYYEGRYRDRNCTDITLELRQRFLTRSSAAVWIGAGTVFPRFADFRLSHVLLEAGLGYRFYLSQNTNVRADFGVGRGSTGFVLALNESF